jgi:uncharacterized caspase-like protein
MDSRIAFGDVVQCVLEKSNQEQNPFLVTSQRQRFVFKQLTEPPKPAPQVASVEQSKPVSTLTQAQPRVALVIGNAKYDSAPLNNPTHDAEAIAAVLRDSRFQVDLRLNTTLREMSDVIEAFWKKAPKGGVRLFYFSGHAAAVDGEHYIIPIDARITRKEDLKYQALSLGTVQNAMAETRQRTVDDFIAYATSPGTVAADGSGDYGIFTEVLLQEIRRPSLEMYTIFRNVREGVMKATNGQQRPEINSSTSNEFYFFPIKANTFESPDLNIIILDTVRNNPFVSQVR